jgi:hypothetical protein
VDARSGGCGRSSGGRAGSSAAPAAAAGAAPGAAGVAARPSAASAAAAEGDHGGACATGDDCFIMQCAHCNLCPVPSRQPRLDPTKNTDIEDTQFDIEAQKLRYHIQISKEHFSISRNLRYRYKTTSKLKFDIDVSLISYCVDIEVPGFDIEGSSISYCIDIVCYNI